MFDHVRNAFFVATAIAGAMAFCESTIQADDRPPLVTPLETISAVIQRQCAECRGQAGRVPVTGRGGLAQSRITKAERRATL